MHNISYVVLHYQAIQETLLCIDSIKKHNGSDDFQIVVVDNASPNQTGIHLEKMFSDDPTVTVIRNKTNLGFANGLNTGIDYLRAQHESVFIVLLNNDTILQSENWSYVINEKYKKYRFAVLGPDIISINEKGRHCNPAHEQDVSILGLIKLVFNKVKDLILYYTFLKNVSIWIKNTIKGLIQYSPSYIYSSSDLINVQLQGSCIVLSDLYFLHYDNLYSKTFLYFEEAILKYRCNKNNLVIMYSPDLVISHEGSVSVNTSFNTLRERKLFYLKHSLQSCLVFLFDRLTRRE